MGKKKTQKTKEIAVAIAETSTSKSDHGAAESVQRRKRGRPRKVADEAQNEENSEQLPLPPEVAETPPEKKARASTGDEQPPPPAVEEGGEKQEPKTGDASRSRGRRKNKPRKSS